MLLATYALAPTDYCLEEVFSETELPAYGVLGNWGESRAGDAATALSLIALPPLGGVS
jgi:hypothetical protein